jgi:hypothetical protein
MHRAAAGEEQSLAGSTTHGTGSRTAGADNKTHSLR